MHLENLLQYILITRPGIVVGSFFFVILSAYISHPMEFPLSPAILAALGVAFAAAAGSLMNDAFDWKADQINNPHRALPQGKISLYAAIRYALILTVIALLLFAAVNKYVFLSGSTCLFLLFFYSWKARMINGLLSNALIAFTVATMLSFGALITETFTLRMFLLFFFWFGMVLGREILGDVTDKEGDRIQGLKTLPIQKGETHAVVLAVTFLFLTLMGSWSFFAQANIAPDLFLLPILISYALFIRSVFRNVAARKIRVAQILLKAGIFLYPTAFAFSVWMSSFLHWS